MLRPDEGLIHTWLDGELDAAEAARVEALVKSDPEWAAAAAEARGLIAASSRIVGALDDVPTNVVPTSKPVAASPAARPVRRAMPPWMLRAAAVLIVVTGSAVVLSRSDTVDVPTNEAAQDISANELVATPPAVAPQAAASAEERTLSTPPRAKRPAGGGQALAEADAKRSNALSDIAGKSAMQERAAAPQVAQVQPQSAQQLQQLQAGARQQSQASGAGTAASAPPALARADAAEQRKTQADSLGALKKEDDKLRASAPAAAGLSATARDAGATGNRVLPESKALTGQVVTTGAEDPRRAFASRESVTGTTICFRERAVGRTPGILHRVVQASDTTAIALEPLAVGAAAGAPAALRSRDASITRTTYRLGGDTLFVPLAAENIRVATRVPCPAP